MKLEGSRKVTFTLTLNDEELEWLYQLASQLNFLGERPLQSKRRQFFLDLGMEILQNFKKHAGRDLQSPTKQFFSIMKPTAESNDLRLYAVDGQPNAEQEKA